MKVNLIQLYQQAFGYIGFPAPRMNTNVSVDPLDQGADIPVNDSAKYEGMSAMGTPLFMPCRLEDYMLPNEPLITINGQNVIIKTILTGVKGSVKELINSDDYVIKIQGIIVNEESDDYPEDDIRALRKILEMKDTVYISNRLLTLFDIHQVAIESFVFTAIEGHQDCQAYEIACVSDWPVDLILKNQK